MPTHILWLIPLLPLAGFLVNGLLALTRGARTPRPLAAGIACATVAASFLITLALGLGGDGDLVSSSFEWITDSRSVVVTADPAPFAVSFGLLLDPLALVMVLVVTGVGFLIHVYSIGYMENDPGFARYFAYLNLFTGLMLILVLADSFPVLFIGWEGVGLCSYLLIGFWYEEATPPDAGRKAFIVNRIGDAGFLLGMAAIFGACGTLNFREVFAAVPALAETGGTLVWAIPLCLFIGAVGKSAQIPLFVWLPDAMAGPTPVSALIHAATMVTAGIYMMVRCHLLFLSAPAVMALVAVVGAATLLGAAAVGLAQTDIKKVLAYSTVSQLGYMCLGVGAGAFVPAVFHLVTHAFFKALLFLGAGSVIHALGGEQDVRKMGGLRRSLKTTFWTFFLATLAITGAVPLSGFFSKDAILAGVLFSPSLPGALGWSLYLAGMAGGLLTAAYMFRLLFLTFYGQERLGAEQKARLHESPAVMTLPLVLLAVLSVVGLGLNLPGGHGFLEGHLAPVLADAHLPAAHPSWGTELLLFAGAWVVALGGWYLAWRHFLPDDAPARRLAERFPGLRRWLAGKGFVDEAYDQVVVRPFFGLCRRSDRFDQGWLDETLNLGGRLTQVAGHVTKLFQTGYLRDYLVWFLAGVAAWLWWIWRG